MALPYGEGNWNQGAFGEGGAFVEQTVTGVSASTELFGVAAGESGGWGLSPWGEPFGWGSVLSVEVFVTGIEATSTSGTVAVTGIANIVVAGEAALVINETGVAVDAGSNHGVTGEAAPTVLGTVTVSGKGSVDLTGVVGTGQLGTAASAITANVPVTGVQGNTALGEEEVDSNVNVDVTRNTGRGAIGIVDVTGIAVVNVTGVVGTVTLGVVSQASSNTVQVTGLLGTISLGSVAIKGKSTVYLTGVSATGRVSRPLVWGLIDTSQTPNWVPIAA